jgi:hypothetical protein
LPDFKIFFRDMEMIKSHGSALFGIRSRIRGKGGEEEVGNSREISYNEALNS